MKQNASEDVFFVDNNDNNDVKKIAMESLAAMNTAITSARLYPSGSALIANSVQRLYLLLASLFEQVEAVFYAESEKNLLIQGKPLFEKEQKRPQVVSFVSLMLDLGIRSLSIRKGITEKELAGFIRIMVKTGDEVKEAGGLGRLIKEINAAGHLKIDEQIYVKMAETKPSHATEADRQNLEQLKVESLKAAMHSILKGKTAAFADIADVEGVGALVKKMARQGKKSLVATIIDRIGDGLKNDDAQIRAAAANMMAEIDAQFEDVAELMEERLAMSQKLSQWIARETMISDAYEKVTEQMKKLSRTLIGNDQAEAAGHILEAYHQIYTGNLKKDEAIRSLSASLLNRLATDDILDLMLKDPPPDGSGKKKEDIYSLVLLGTTTVEMLLDRLHDSHNRSERKRIIQVLSKTGNPAVTPLLERIQQNGPWFYIRNLVLLLGRLGTPDHLKLLEQMLAHEDFRVQREAVFAIQNIGEQEVDEIFLRNIFKVDEETQVLMISVLGLLKSRPAVPVLIEILESRKLGKTKKTKSGTLIKTCEALGRIKDPAAEPVLKKMASSKGFLSILAQDPEVRAAAKNALAAYKKK